MPSKDPVKRREADRRYRKNNRDAINARKRAAYHADPEKHQARAAEYKEKNREKVYAYNREWSKGYRAGIRARMIAAYGGCCACCGESEPRFLQLDHINDDGAEHRRRENATGVALFRRLEKAGWPKDDLRLLCANCNFGRRMNGGRCPHEDDHA